LPKKATKNKTQEDMTVVKIAINGFGRIGRLVFREAWGRKDVEIVAIVDMSTPAASAHLLKYDSVHGIWDKDVTSDEGNLYVDGKAVQALGIMPLEKLPWGEMGVDIVIESTGIYSDAEKAKGHLVAGAKKVILTAPGKNEDITVVMGVNQDKYDPKNHQVISNASCTTNCLAPAAKVLHEAFGIRRGLMTTIHACTNDQKIADSNHKDLRRARSASLSMIPTTTGAAKAVSLVLPELKGKLNGFAVRVPVADVSLVDLTAELDKKTTKEEINAALAAAAAGPMKDILGYCDLPLVSIDFKGDRRSSIVDALSTMVMEDNLAKVILWYDNEWGYSCRVVDLMQFVAERL